MSKQLTNPVASTRPAKRQRKQVQTDVPSVVFDCKNFEHLNQLQGLKRIEISPLAQKFVGCRVGENITTDTPWILVEKEKIEDHVEFYEESSEFAPIIADIKTFPTEHILVGTYHYSQDKNIEFYICVTPKAQVVILEAVEKEKEALRQKILNSFSPKSRKWKSLGSESQVDCDLCINLRPLVVIDMEGCIPIHKQNVRFAMQDVEMIRDGYTELITTRSSVNSIMRKRIDFGIQASPLKRDKGVQVMIQSQSNKSLQYSIEFNAVELTGNKLKNLHNFISDKFLKLGDVLKLNFSLDLYFDDYKHLRKEALSKRFVESTEIKSYQDVINCRRRQISCFTWNAIFSGIVAAAHASTPMFRIENKRPTLDIEHETVFGTHFVLIWHYSDNLLPKLYLHASRDVTALSFCPYDANILVAGYDNGQIAVWDLTNKLDSYKARDFLTDIQQKNHLLIAEQTTWFKQPLADNHVFPVLCCSFEAGHCDTVTAIQWIPSSKFIAPQRVYKDSIKNEPHMQFVTASIDGYRILVWDLFIPIQHRTQTFKKKCVRLSTKPAALLTNISPLSALKKDFQPVCRLIIKQLSFPITNVLMQNQMYCYIAQNPQTLKDLDALTYFQVSENEHDFDYTPRLYFTTGIGTFHEASWEASDYDPKFYAVNEKCTVEKFADVHDGPILVCETNPCIPNVILTIGGSVVAIWYLSKAKIPILWRKSRERYITGMWSFIHPLSFLVVRSDTRYEVWNVVERSNVPIQIFKYKGYKLTKLYKDTTRSHVRKKTCVITNTVGAFKLYTVPSESKRHEFNIKESINYLERTIKIKENLHKIKQKFFENQKTSLPEEVEEEKIPAPVPAESASEAAVETKIVPLTSKIKWELKLEKNMRKVLYENKKLNLREIEKNKNILKKMVIDNDTQEHKIGLKKVKAEALFKKTKDHVIIDDVKKYRRASLKCDAKAVKEAYLNEYKKIEADVVNTISQSDYLLVYNWPKVLMNHLQRYKLERTQPS